MSLLRSLGEKKKVSAPGSEGNDPERNDECGKCLTSNKKGEHKKAIESLNKAIELAPNVDKYHYRLGLIYDGQGRHDEAVEAFKKAVEAEEAEV